MNELKEKITTALLCSDSITLMTQAQMLSVVRDMWEYIKQLEQENQELADTVIGD